MHPGGEALGGSHAAEEVGEGAALAGVEAREESVLVLGGEACEVTDEVVAGGREVHRVQPAVVGVPAPFEHPAPLEGVHERDQAGGRGAELRGERLLAAARLAGDRAEEPGLGRCEVDGGHPLAEAPRRVRAELREEEGRAGGSVHGMTIALDIRCRRETMTKCNDYSSGRPVMSSPHARRGGPPLLAPALAWAALTVAAGVLHPGTRPGADPSATLAVLHDHPVALQLSSLALLASAAPLAVWVGAVHHRLQRLGLRVAGPTLGLAGGLLAAAVLAVSGAAQWAAGAAALPGGEAAVAGLAALSFALGGPAFAVLFGLLLAGCSVPTLLAGVVPRGLAWAGLVLAAVGVVAVLGLAAPPLQYLLPVVRFGGLIWLVWFSAVLPSVRRRVGEPAVAT